MIEYSSPTGLLTLLDKQDPPDQEKGGVDADLYAFYSVIQSAVSKGDAATAREGLDKYQEKYEYLADDLKSDDQVQTDGGLIESSVKKGMEDHIPTIILKAESNNQPDIVADGFDTYLYICHLGKSNQFIQDIAYDGLSKIIRRTLDNTFLLTEAWSAIGEMLLISSAHYRSAVHFTAVSEDVYSIPISTAAGRESAIELLETLPEIIANFQPRGAGPWSIFGTRNFTTLVENITRLVITESSNFQLERELAQSLADVAQEMQGGGLPESTETAYLILFEAAIICSHENKNRMGFWAWQIARVCEGDSWEGIEIYWDNLIEGDRHPRILDIPEYTPFTKIDNHAELSRELKARIEDELDQV